MVLCFYTQTISAIVVDLGPGKGNRDVSEIIFIGTFIPGFHFPDPETHPKSPEEAFSRSKGLCCDTEIRINCKIDQDPERPYPDTCVFYELLQGAQKVLSKKIQTPALRPNNHANCQKWMEECCFFVKTSETTCAVAAVQPIISLTEKPKNDASSDDTPRKTHLRRVLERHQKLVEECAETDAANGIAPFPNFEDTLEIHKQCAFNAFSEPMLELTDFFLSEEDQKRCNEALLKYLASLQ